MLKLLLIENQKIISAGINSLLHSHFNGMQVDIISGVDHLNDAPHVGPNLVLLGCGHNVHATQIQIAKILSCYPQIPLVLCDQSRGYTDAPGYFRKGISGYLSIGSEADLLADCIRTVLKGHKFMSVCGLLKVMGRNEPELISTPPRAIGVFGKLTKREREIALHISKGTRTGELAKTLHLSCSTISTFKANIFRKLNMTNVVELNRAVVNTIRT